jgi:hypothetical protein
LEQLIPKQTRNFCSSCIVKDQANGVRSGKVWWGQCVQFDVLWFANQ